eukprot:gnl/Hemi2/9329_TR3251_c0_g1_i1.p1 gnl/Hemi2/9329_TR3251_c0_g1~~gnl/Hemi2/9329_TR3251_c0_g1_i1.p1  ORF type:complete len:155 (+),score=79.55 gnl/Hemi2/9329_TR3251_c0_g1_i1:76-540(+)
MAGMASSGQAAAVVGSSSSSSSTLPAESVLTRRRLQELVHEIDPTERLDAEVEEVLLEIADDFIESVTNFACLLAKHRNSASLDVKDLQLHLEKNWNMRIPGFACDEAKPFRKPTLTEAHKQRMALLRRAAAQEDRRLQHAILMQQQQQQQQQR